MIRKRIATLIHLETTIWIPNLTRVRPSLSMAGTRAVRWTGAGSKHQRRHAILVLPVDIMLLLCPTNSSQCSSGSKNDTTRGWFFDERRELQDLRRTPIAYLRN